MKTELLYRIVEDFHETGWNFHEASWIKFHEQILARCVREFMRTIAEGVGNEDLLVVTSMFVQQLRQSKDSDYYNTTVP